MTMMTDAELTILSLLAEEPRYGYDIQRLVDERGLRDWLPIGFSSIYYILNKLERQKMLTSEMRPDGRGPARKRYSITDAGKGVVQTALANLLRQPRVPGTGIELALVNLHVLAPATVYRMLIHHHEDLKGQLKFQQDTWTHYQVTHKNPADNLSALYSHSITMIEAELAWLEKFLDVWRNEHKEALDAATAKVAAVNPVDNIHEAPTALRRSPDSLHALQKLKRIKPDSGEE